jgi:Glycosyl hydrolase family 99
MYIKPRCRFENLPEPAGYIKMMENLVSRQSYNRECPQWIVMSRLILGCFAIGTACAALQAGRINDPADSVVRIRARLTTSAERADLSLATGAVVQARAGVASASEHTRATADGPACRLENESTQEVEIECQWLVANLPPHGLAEWSVSLDPPSDSVIEIYNANRANRPRLVDRVTDHAEAIRFGTPIGLLRDGSPLPVGSAGVPRVVAFYYPWYLHSTWTDPLLKDRSPRRYSTDQEPEVVVEFAEARRAGLDALAMSWVGVNRPMRVAVAAAHQTGMLVSTLIETDAAREGGRKRNPIDPDIMEAWIAEIVDRYGSDPVYLTYAGRPVIFVYAAELIDPATWRTIMANIRASGRHPLIMAEGTNAAWLEGLDGAFLYASVRMSTEEVKRFNLTQSLRVRTYHLLPRSSTEARRIWAATVSPGYDDTLIPTRVDPLFRDRADGAYYDAQWRAAIAARPDWVLVTSWNEWYENTQIETSELYGDAYVRSTAAWARRFRCEMNPPSIKRPDLSCDGEGPASGGPR